MILQQDSQGGHNEKNMFVDGTKFVIYLAFSKKTN